MKTLTKYVSWKCKFKFDSRKCNSNQNWNNDQCQCECKNEKLLFMRKILYLQSCEGSCKNGKCLASIIDDSVITADEMIETTKIKFVWKNVTCRIKKIIFYLPFY